MNFICRSGAVWTGIFLFAGLGITFMSSCAKGPESGSGSSSKGTPAEAEKFVADAEKRLFDLNLKYARADWVKSVFITDDTEAISADANKELIAATTALVDESRKFDGLQLSPDVARKLMLLKLSLTLPAPKDPAERDELTKLAASLEGDYGKGKFCPEGDNTKVSQPRRPGRDHGKQPRPGGVETGLDRLASDFPALPERLRALRRTQQQGRQGDGFQRHGGDVARQV